MVGNNKRILFHQAQKAMYIVIPWTELPRVRTDIFFAEEGSVEVKPPMLVLGGYDFVGGDGLCTVPAARKPRRCRKESRS